MTNFHSTWNPFTDAIPDEIAKTWGGNKTKTIMNIDFCYKKGIVFNNKNIFDDCSNEQILKNKFKNLAMQMHPDKGGDTLSMQNLNKFYKEAKFRLKMNTLSSFGTIKFEDTFDF